MSWLGYKYGMLELRRERSVFCSDSPIIFIQFGGKSSKVNHWLDSEDHSRLHFWSAIFLCFVINIGFFVELYSNSVTRIFSDNRASLPFHVLRDFIPDISEIVPWFHLFDSDFPSSFCNSNEFFCRLTNTPYSIHTRGITKVSSYNRCYVYIEDITFFKYFIWSRHAMTDNIIERYTGTSFIGIWSLSIFIISEIIDTSRNTSILQNKCIHDIIQLKRTNSRLYVCSYHIESHSSEFSSFSYAIDLFRGFNEYFSHKYKIHLQYRKKSIICKYWQYILYMNNYFNQSRWYINRTLRAKATDYAMFYGQLERIVMLWNEWEKFRQLYGLLYTTLQSFPEIVKFFATQDFTIIQESWLAFDSDDVVYFRSLAASNPDVLSLARTLLGRRYMSRDVWFYSSKDQSRATQYRTMLYPAHAMYPEKNWHGYPPPNTYNISEAVYFFEQAIVWWADYFRNSLTLYTAIKSWRVTNIYLTSFIIACMKLEFLNILPCNTVEFVASKKSITFSDIIEDLLETLDTLQPGISSQIMVWWVSVRVALQQARTRRQLQTYNIQNISLGREGDDTVRLSRWVGTEIARISIWSSALTRDIQGALSGIFSNNHLSRSLNDGEVRWK